MGIPIVLPDKIAGSGCAACFDADETPERIFVVFADIEKGPDWIGPDREPPNGIWELIWAGVCEWIRVAGGWSISYKVDGAGSHITATSVFQLNGIFGFDAVQCNSWFELESLPGPTHAFDGGLALIVMTADCPIVSMSALSESVGLEGGADLLADPFVGADEVGVIRYARKQDATNVKIKIDCS